MSRIRTSSTSLTVDENSGLTNIQILPPIDTRYSSSPLIVTIQALPTDGTIFLADGVTEVSVGEVLTVAQLTGLKLIAAPGLFGVSSTFAYSVTDPSGAFARGAATITIAPDSLPPVTTPVSLTVAENANATAMGIAAPIDPNYTASQLTITVTTLPSDGAVDLADGTTSVSVGQTLTVAQLMGLTFMPTAGLFAQDSTFTYNVSDPSGLSATGTVALMIGPTTPPPTVAWSSGSVSGTEGSAIALGPLSATAPAGEPLQSLVVGAIPAGAALSDGSHSYTATAGSPSVDVTGWTLSSLNIMPPNDANFTLTATATEQDAAGNTSSASASETVSVNPLAPTIAWSTGSVSGAAASAIALGTLNDTINGLSGDSNTLQSLVVAGIPAGVTLADGTHSFTAATESTSVNVAGWNLTNLTILAASAMSFSLTATATEQDAAGNTSSASASQAVTVGSSSSYVDGSAQAAAATAQLPNILNNYAARPPWEVAGVDYSVGVPSGITLKDPTIAGNLPGGAVYSAANHAVTVTGNGVTLNGFDFSLDGGIEVIIQASNVTVENSEFKVGTNPGTNNTGAAYSGTVLWAKSSASNLTLLNNEFDGNNVPVTSQLGSTLVVDSTGSVVMQYNYFHNSGGDMIDFSGGPQTQIIQYNLFRDTGTSTAHQDVMQWYNSNVVGGDIGFNTIYQTTPQSGGGMGLLTVNAEGPNATISNLSVNNDTILAPSSATPINWIVGVTASSGGTANNIVLHDLYIDPTAALNYTGTPWFPTGFYGSNLPTNTAFANITNMVSGITYTSLPTKTSPSPQGYYVGPDASGRSPSLSDVYSVAASPANGTEVSGNTVTITLTMDEPWTVAGTPLLSLNTGGTAIYTGGSGTNTLTFSYTVGNSDMTVAALAITGVNLPAGATIKDTVGNSADLSGALVTFNGLAIVPPTGALPPTIAWSTSSVSGTEGSAITLGSLSATVPTGETLQSLVVGAIPVGAVLSDGSHSFAAAVGSTSVDVTDWVLSSLELMPPNDTNFTLTATATEGDVAGNTSSASASETVSVNPLAPTVAWSAGSVSGAAGSAIALGTLSDTLNGLSGDSNTLQSLVVAGIPVGAVLSDGSHSFTATTGSTAVNVAGWNLSNLTILAASAMSFSLTATATEQDAAGNASSANASDAVTVTTPGGATSWPYLINTGIPSGTALTPASSNTISQPGIYNAFSFHGPVYITASNVILQNCQITGGNSDPFEISINGGLSNVKINNCTIIGAGTDSTQTGVYGVYVKGNSQVTINASDISGVGTGVTINDGQVTVENSYIHDFGSGPGTHYNGIYYGGGGASDPNFSLLIEHNTIVNQLTQTDAVFIASDFGAIKNVMIDNNILAGGSYALYVEDTGHGSVTNVSLTNNHLGAGLYGTVDFNGASPSLFGNVNDAATILPTLR